MRTESILIGALLSLLAACQEAPPEPAQGFAGLGQAAGEFQAVARGHPLEFPRDHGAHDGYRIEWWYITANLTDDADRQWGAQWTLFRSALRPEVQTDGWTSSNVWMGHIALTTPWSHNFAESFARGGIGQAGVQAQPFKAWIDNWLIEATCSEGISELRLEADAEGFGYELQLRSEGPLVLHGEQGYSEKSGEGQASYYYSQPFYEASGVVTLDGESFAVNGRAWLDREWSSQPLSARQEGWDWFSLHLGDEYKLMLFQVRHDSGEHYRAGTLIATDGSTQSLQPEQIFIEAQAFSHQQNGKQVPTSWQVRVPDFNIHLTIDAIEPQAWMSTTFPYWEGPVTVQGSFNGLGYLEMTGY